MPGGEDKGLAEYSGRKRRSEWEILAGMDPLDYLAARFSQYREKGDHQNAERITLEAMPYLKPKLRSIDHKLSGAVHVSVRIGGDDHVPSVGTGSSESDSPDEGGDE